MNIITRPQSLARVMYISLETLILSPCGLSDGLVILLSHHITGEGGALSLSLSRYEYLSFPGSVLAEQDQILLLESGVDLQQHAGEARVVELEVPLVVELEEGRAVRVVLLQVEVVQLRLLGRVTAVLAHVDLYKYNMT